MDEPMEEVGRKERRRSRLMVKPSLSKSMLSKERPVAPDHNLTYDSRQNLHRKQESCTSQSSLMSKSKLNLNQTANSQMSSAFQKSSLSKTQAKK